MKKPRGILLFGYPGSGKGTQGRILCALPGFHHVAMGDIFRSLKPGHSLYAQVNAHIERGDLVPDELTMELFAQHVAEIAPKESDFLVIDGVPRNAQQVALLDDMINIIKIFKLSIYNEKVVVERIKKRANDQGRPDDASADIITHRLQVYREATEHCIRSYQGTILTRIQANQPIFDVHLDIIHALGKMRHIQFP